MPSSGTRLRCCRLAKTVSFGASGVCGCFAPTKDVETASGGLGFGRVNVQSIPQPGRGRLLVREYLTEEKIVFLKLVGARSRRSRFMKNGVLSWVLQRGWVL